MCSLSRCSGSNVVVNAMTAVLQASIPRVLDTCRSSLPLHVGIFNKILLGEDIHQSDSLEIEGRIERSRLMNISKTRANARSA